MVCKRGPRRVCKGCKYRSMLFVKGHKSINEIMSFLHMEITQRSGMSSKALGCFQI